MQGGELTAKSRLAGRRAGTAVLVDPPEDEQVRCRLVADGQHLRHGHRSSVGEPAQAGGLGREEARRCGRMGLGEHPPPVTSSTRQELATSPPWTRAALTTVIPSTPATASTTDPSRGHASYIARGIRRGQPGDAAILVMARRRAGQAGRPRRSRRVDPDAVFGFGITRLEFATGQDSYLDDDDEVAIDNVAYQDLFGGQAMLGLITMDDGHTIAELFDADGIAQLRPARRPDGRRQYVSVITPLRCCSTPTRWSRVTHRAATRLVASPGRSRSCSRRCRTGE